MKRLQIFFLIPTIVLFLSSCNKPSSSHAAPNSGAASESAVTLTSSAGPSAGGPCDLLSLNEVRQFFPTAQAGRRDPEREKMIQHPECNWSDSAGIRQLTIQETGKIKSVEDDIHGWSEALIDLRMPDAKRNVRYEKLIGVGDDAMAVVEIADKKRGILETGAFVVIKRGGKSILMIFTPFSDRTSALKIAENLGREAAGRM